MQGGLQEWHVHSHTYVYLQQGYVVDFVGVVECE